MKTFGYLVLVCALAVSGAFAKTITFSGYTWNIKNATSAVGPGPNLFSDSSNNVWVDSSGRLHLAITYSHGKWYCAEVVLSQSLGYGHYRFYLDSPVDSLDPSVVLGLFTWDDLAAYNHREIDIEFARWGVATNRNAQYTVQPYNVGGNQYVFEEPAGLTQSTHAFDWQSGSVLFQSWAGAVAYPPAPAPFASFNYTNVPDIPLPGGENARMNLWLFNGKAPAGHNRVEVIVNRFEYVQ